MAFFNTDAAQVVQQNLWQVVLIGSRFGDIWTFRVVLLIFCAVLLFVAEYYRALMPQLADGIWRGLPWLGAIFIGLSHGDQSRRRLAIAALGRHRGRLAARLGSGFLAGRRADADAAAADRAGALRRRAESAGAAGGSRCASRALCCRWSRW